MKRISLLLLALLLVLSACTSAAPEPTPEPTVVPTGGTELWYHRAQNRYNMQYDGFGEYLEMLCDDFYGGSVETILGILPQPDKDDEIAQKRAWYGKEYGSDWRYVISEKHETELGEKACLNFAAELNELCGRIEVLTEAANAWGDTEWADFASGVGCGVEDAKRLVEAYAAMADACRAAEVTAAIETEIVLGFSGSRTEALQTTEKNTIYEVNGLYVSEMLIDTSYSIVNLIY